MLKGWKIQSEPQKNLYVFQDKVNFEKYERHSSGSSPMEKEKR